jgi:hypothetical protein
VVWRFPLAFQIFFTLCIYCMCPFLPDSPRLLIRKGKYEEAYEVLAALEGHGATVDSPAVHAQFNIIKDILDREQVNSYSWWQLLSGRGPAGVLRRMILGAWMQAMNQISGINVVSALNFLRQQHPIMYLLECRSPLTPHASAPHLS